jgi:hypothetical protein
LLPETGSLAFLGLPEFAQPATVRYLAEPTIRRVPMTEGEALIRLDPADARPASDAPR